MAQTTRACPTCSTPLPGVASFCYVCGTATPTGIDMATGERLAVARSTMSSADLRGRIQRVLGPGYELGDRIGAGGFAEVFRAQDLRLKRSIAVKVMRPDLGLTPGMLERFRREAETVAALRHPNIVPIYDVGEGDGIAFILMPFIEGESLRARMEREGAMPAEEVRRILREAASGLAVAHEAGVIHRDIKPENIMLEGREQRVLLMDFGIAKAVGGDEDTPMTEEGVAPALTSTGIIVGTPQYMSPEQACGDKTIDARTDQYSLAVVGYRMLAGTLPFEGDSTRAVLYQQLVAEPTPLSTRVSGVPDEIATAIGRAMQKEPRDRFESMTAFATALATGTTTIGESIAAPATKPAPAKPARPKQAPRTGAAAGGLLASTRNRVIAGVAALALLVVAIRTMTGGTPAVPEDEFIPTSVLGGDLDPAVTPPSPSEGTASDASAPTPPPVPSRTSPPRSTATTARGRAAPPPAAPAPAAAATGAATPTCSALANANRWDDALATCTAAANGGDPVAMRVLGGMYDRGTGVAEDPAQAVTWYRRAAPNDAEAKFQLSRLFEIGRGTGRDLQANITYLREAAAMGHQQATLTLASRLETGAGMGRDYDEAAIWYQRAAGRGSVLAMMKLADWSRRGRGVPKDEAKAVEWFTKAADGGSPEGAWEAARALLDGKGVPQDETRGMTLLRRAAQLGSAQAAEELAKRQG
ncbi:MAG: SEL1-like repeat protein [Gemmatimonadetes bacterium]|nr:SEL1-like repeat protein [Gemmatimonadota bacterium]MCB9518670.1 SEL1-like repeat protein [Gemmatimonadales bacterium]HRX19048.1 serine/threonine-protein kinase [Gemmatimonadales bacterium]